MIRRNFSIALGMAAIALSPAANATVLNIGSNGSGTGNACLV